ncbi:hypothetical protein CFter6_3239 [Collimonas fungivorans]|uniref:Uncharacterized protein n=1 Tax=Collimonas fungivorans TaxID=158899 RepID=A0A127PDV4_9BURK|nr:hypothetical protein CFter6_3239 [Collimonas fungivorans]
MFPLYKRRKGDVKTIKISDKKARWPDWLRFHPVHWSKNGEQSGFYKS